MPPNSPTWLLVQFSFSRAIGLMTSIQCQLLPRGSPFSWFRTWLASSEQISESEGGWEWGVQLLLNPHVSPFRPDHRQLWRLSLEGFTGILPSPHQTWWQQDPTASWGEWWSRSQAPCQSCSAAYLHSRVILPEAWGQGSLLGPLLEASLWREVGKSPLLS